MAGATVTTISEFLPFLREDYVQRTVEKHGEEVQGKEGMF